MGWTNIITQSPGIAADRNKSTGARIETWNNKIVILGVILTALLLGVMFGLYRKYKVQRGPFSWKILEEDDEIWDDTWDESVKIDLSFLDDCETMTTISQFHSYFERFSEEDVSCDDTAFIIDNMPC